MINAKIFWAFSYLNTVFLHYKWRGTSFSLPRLHNKNNSQLTISENLMKTCDTPEIWAKFLGAHTS